MAVRERLAAACVSKQNQPVKERRSCDISSGRATLARWHAYTRFTKADTNIHTRHRSCAFEALRSGSWGRVTRAARHKITARASPCSRTYTHTQLLVLSSGRTAFFGPASHALEHFTSLGYPCPPRTNPAEFILDLVRAQPRCFAACACVSVSVCICTHIDTQACGPSSLYALVFLADTTHVSDLVCAGIWCRIGA
jgi:hypothetical protein